MKRLVTEVLTTKWGVKLWRVKEQTHRENEFGHNGSDTFIAGNGHKMWRQSNREEKS